MGPLSDREQQILEEIEKRLVEEDPRFARGVAERARQGGARRLRLGAAAFVVGLGLLVGFFVSSSIIVGVLAFGGMVAGIVLMAGAIRGALSAKDATDGGPKERVSGILARWEERIRNRYKRS